MIWELERHVKKVGFGNYGEDFSGVLVALITQGGKACYVGGWSFFFYESLTNYWFRLSWVVCRD